MHGRTHICATVMEKESDKLSSAALEAPRRLIVSSAGIQCSFFKKERGSSTGRSDNPSCAVRELAVHCSVLKGHRSEAV